MDFTVRPIGAVESQLVDRAAAPKQADEGAPEACIVLHGEFAPAARDLRAGDALVVLTWLHHAQRDVTQVHPRDDPCAVLTGVFSTRSADRPNPIGLHRVTVVDVEGLRIRVDHLEAVDGTPVIDLKPVLPADG